MDRERGCEGMRYIAHDKNVKKQKEKISLIWNEKNRYGLSYAGHVLLFSIVFLCFPLWKFLSNWHDFKGTYLIDRNQLSTTQGEILSTKIYTSEGRRRKIYYHYSIKYQFAYHGRIFRSDEVTFDDNYSQSPGFAQEYIEKYQRGKEVTVYFDPKDPSFSVLEPESINDTSFPIYWLFSFLSLIGFTISGCILLKRKFFG
jgi:Protein of unknown function (DUF3592)